MRLSLILPAYNESHKIAQDLQILTHYFSNRPYEVELIVIDDGSQDETRTELERWKAWAPISPRFSYESYQPNRGKGHAVKQGVNKGVGEIIGFMDTGSCLPLAYIDQAMELISKGADGVIGTRHSGNARFLHQPTLVRKMGTFVFRHLMHLFFGISVSDTQCGLKVFRKEVAKSLFSQITTEGFMFDIELLALCAKQRLNIREMAVEWKTDPDSRFKLVSGSFRNAKELWRIKKVLG